MAAKSTLRVGQSVTFGRAGERQKSGTIKRLNPKTAVVKSGSSEYDVTYRLIKARAKAGRTRAASGKGKRGISAARRDALLLRLEREWEQQERRYGHDPLIEKAWRSNPKKKKLTPAKREALLLRLEKEWAQQEKRYGHDPSIQKGWRSNPRRRKAKTTTTRRKRPAAKAPRRNSKGQFVRTRRH